MNEKPCSHSELDAGSAHVGVVRCARCHQRFGDLEPSSNYPTIHATFGKFDLVRHAQELAKEARKLGVRVEFDTDIRSPEFGTVLGVRRAVEG